MSKSNTGGITEGTLVVSADCGLYVGLDVHKETIAVAVVRSGRGEPEYRGELSNRPQSVNKLIRRLSEEAGGEVLQFCYEAGPCGYGLYREITTSGHYCDVVAPFLIPRKPMACRRTYAGGQINDLIM